MIVFFFSWFYGSYFLILKVHVFNSFQEKIKILVPSLAKKKEKEERKGGWRRGRVRKKKRIRNPSLFPQVPMETNGNRYFPYPTVTAKGKDVGAGALHSSHFTQLTI